MKTTRCPECGEEIIAGARRCAKCGAVLNLQARKTWVWVLAAVVFAAIVYAGLQAG